MGLVIKWYSVKMEGMRLLAENVQYLLSSTHNGNGNVNSEHNYTFNLSTDEARAYSPLRKLSTMKAFFPL